jgi:hypothetical protein
MHARKACVTGIQPLHHTVATSHVHACSKRTSWHYSSHPVDRAVDSPTGMHSRLARCCNMVFTRDITCSSIPESAQRTSSLRTGSLRAVTKLRAEKARWVWRAAYT